jgi:hypothetical protein
MTRTPFQNSRQQASAVALAFVMTLGMIASVNQLATPTAADARLAAATPPAASAAAPAQHLPRG